MSSSFTDAAETTKIEEFGELRKATGNMTFFHTKCVAMEKQIMHENMDDKDRTAQIEKIIAEEWESLDDEQR